MLGVLSGWLGVRKLIGTRWSFIAGRSVVVVCEEVPDVEPLESGLELGVAADLPVDLRGVPEPFVPRGVDDLLFRGDLPRGVVPAALDAVAAATGTWKGEDAAGVADGAAGVDDGAVGVGEAPVIGDKSMLCSSARLSKANLVPASSISFFGIGAFALIHRLMAMYESLAISGSLR